MKRLLFVAVLAGVVNTFADTWYVNAANYGKGGDGSASNPFGSLQEANDAAAVQDDDTIMVAEGDYDQGSVKYGSVYSHGSGDKAFSGYPNVRLAVSKRLHFEASGRRELTRIIGEYGSKCSGTTVHYMTDCIGCVAVTETGSGSTFKGLTFYRGSQHQSSNGTLASGGITAVDGKGIVFTAVDCLFDECLGRGGGGMGAGGIAFRCVFTHCGGNGYGSAARGVKGYNCLFLRNGCAADGTALATGNYASAVYNCELVNCLIFATGYHNSIRGAANKLYNVAAYDDADKAAYTLTNGTFCCCALREILEGDSDADSVVQLFPGVSQENVLSTNLCVNAYTGDYAPVKGGFLDETGDSDWRELGWIPAEERNLYFDGTPMPDGAPTPIGLLLPAKAVTSGPLPFEDSKLTVNGKKILKPSLNKSIYQGTWPEQVAIGIAPGETKVTGYADYGRPRFVGKDTIWQLLPPKHAADGKLYAPTTIKAIEYEYEYWVDCDYEGDDANGSAEKPFPKLQDAINRLVDSTETLVHVAKGTYDSLQGFTPAADAGGVNSRIFVPTKKSAVILAEEGPEKTIIKGARATTGTTGNGTDAVRCIYAQSGADVAFCGFTITDGHVFGDDDIESSTYCGGAVYSVSLTPAFYDCVVSKSSGRHSIWNGKYFRCRIEQNDIYRRGVVGSSDGNCLFSGSLFANNVDKGGMYDSFFGYVYSFNCSFAETNAPAGGNIWNVNCRCLNAAVYAAGRQDAPNSDGEFIGCVGASSSGKAVNYPEPDNKKANPFFINMRQGDYRLSSKSLALNAGLVKAGKKLTYAYLLNYLRGDINNAKLVHDDGTVNAGCYSDAGVEQPRQVYVSPTGDDKNDGLSEEFPKQTLQAACESATIERTGYAEDIREVVALPGTYKAGSKLHATTTFSGARTIESRVVVPAGMTLRSRDGAETTIIEGQDATVNADEYGCGDNALRCAYVETGARLVGFTLRNGRTRNTTITGYVDDNLGGGAFGHGVDDCFVEDCIIEGCVSRNGAAFSHVTAKRCEIRDNCATGYGSVTRTGALIDCCAHGNYGCNVLNDLIKTIVGCTFASNYSNLAKTEFQPYAMFNCGHGRLVNTVLLGNYRSPSRDAGGSTVSISNCVFGSDVVWAHDEGYEPVDCQNSLTRDEILAFYDEIGRPLSKDSPSVDNGLAGQTAFDVDIDGNPRVMNGTIDVGAFEYDWRPDYSKALAKKGLTVTDVSTRGVVETSDGIVMLTDGGVIEASRTDVKCDCTLGAALDGTGALIVKRNGVEVGRLTASGTLKIPGDAESDSLEFLYEGEGSVALSRMKNDIGMLLLVR